MRCWRSLPASFRARSGSTVLSMNRWHAARRLSSRSHHPDDVTRQRHAVRCAVLGASRSATKTCGSRPGQLFRETAMTCCFSIELWIEWGLKNRPFFLGGGLRPGNPEARAGHTTRRYTATISPRLHEPAPIPMRRWCSNWSCRKLVYHWVLPNRNSVHRRIRAHRNIVRALSDFGVSRLSLHNPFTRGKIKGCIITDFWQNEPNVL
jgi:hypothetical protein